MACTAFKSLLAYWICGAAKIPLCKNKIRFYHKELTWPCLTVIPLHQNFFQTEILKIFREIKLILFFSSFETKDSCELVKEYVYTALVSKCRPRSMTIHDTPSTRRHSFPPDKRARAWTASNSTDIHRKQLGKEKVRCGPFFGFKNLELGISVKHFYFSRLKNGSKTKLTTWMHLIMFSCRLRTRWLHIFHIIYHLGPTHQSFYAVFRHPNAECLSLMLRLLLFIENKPNKPFFQKRVVIIPCWEAL